VRSKNEKQLFEAVRGRLSPAEYRHVVTVERPGDRPVTNILVDGRLWAAVTDEMLRERVNDSPAAIRQWAEGVVRNLLTYLQDGVDVWSDKLADTKFDFLMRCAP
jgi:hypothetical protein